MKPTTRLRFVERNMGAYAQRVLQQWWATDPDSYEDWMLRVNGEWRDVQLEQESQ